MQLTTSGDDLQNTVRVDLTLHDQVSDCMIMLCTEQALGTETFRPQRGLLIGELCGD